MTPYSLKYSLKWYVNHFKWLHNENGTWLLELCFPCKSKLGCCILKRTLPGYGLNLCGWLLLKHIYSLKDYCLFNVNDKGLKPHLRSPRTVASVAVTRSFHLDAMHSNHHPCSFPLITLCFDLVIERLVGILTVEHISISQSPCPFSLWYTWIQTLIFCCLFFFLTCSLLTRRT